MISGTRTSDTGDLWRLAMEHSPVGMALIAPTGEFLAVNAALCDMLGHEPEELASLTVQEITHPDDIGSDRRLAQDALDGRIDSFRVPKRYLRADGTVLSAELTLALVRDDRGDPLHFVSQVVDLSERRAFEARLEAVDEQIDVERRRLRAVFDAADVGLLLIDADGRYLTHNRRHREFVQLAFGTGHVPRVGKDGHVFDADQTRRLTREENPAVRAAAGEEFSDTLIWIGAEETSRRALSASARSVRDRSGAFLGAALACRDVTDLVRALEVKDDFLASVSHELRTPLTSALAYLELLDGTQGLAPAARTQVEAVRRNALRLSRLVADLLFTATAASGEQVIERFHVDLAMVVRQAVEAAQPEADEDRIELVADLPATLDVLADGIRMRHVADHLLANALTYTPAGGRVRVTLSATETSAELVVADSGEGIEAADLGAVFATFVRGDNARRRLSSGTGLGLTIVRTIVEAHSGDVVVESAVGVGTTVRVVLPR